MIGQTVSHYRIVESLGQGGFGVVYVAEDLHLARRVAIKFSSAAAGNTQFRSRFLREARAASALNHPNIAGIYDYGETESGQPFIVMELVSGTDLHRVIRAGKLRLPQIAGILEGVASALAEAHRRGILHRDIKPSNIIITETGDVKVLDFGLAKQIEAAPSEGGASDSPMLTSDTIEGQVLGTPAYMSPEQVRDEVLGPPSDLFALGSVMYECVTGRAPFSGKNPVDVLASVLHVEPPPPSVRNPHATPRMDRIAMKLLAKDRAARYQTADEVLLELRALRHSLDTADTQETILLPASTARTAQISGGTLGSVFTRTLATLATPLNRTRLVAALAIMGLAAAALWRFLPGGTYQPAPDSLRWYQEGVAALRDGTYFKASQALQRAVLRDPQFSLAHARLAEAWLELEYGDRAKEEMLRAVPPGSKPRLTRAEQEYEQAIGLTLTGDLAGAIRKFRDMADSAPDSEKADALLELGRSYERKEDLKSALAAYQEAAKRQPQNPAAQLRLGIQYARQLDQARATEAFRQAESVYRGLSNFEGLAEVQYQSGVLQNRVGKAKEARALLEQALEMSQHIGSASQQILVLIQMSGVDVHFNDLATAEKDATKAIELARGNGLETLTMRGLIDLGNAFFIRGDIEEARKHYTHSLEIARRYRAERAEARALLSLGSLEMQHGEVDAGTPHIRQALAWYQKHSGQKESIQALTLLARGQRQKGEYAGALESFQQQLEISRQLGLGPQVAQAQQGVGSVLLAQGRFPEALAAYKEEYDAASHSGADLSLQYSLIDQASVLWRLGRYREAEQFLERLGAKPARAMQGEADRVRAEMLLSQRQFAAAAAACRKMLAEGGLNDTQTVVVKITLGKALLGSGGKAEGAALLPEAAALAAKTGNPRLVAEASMERPEAQQFFAKSGNLERAWHAWLEAARVSGSRDDAQKAADAVAQLQQKWDSVSYAGYAKRPDVQFERAQLDKLLGRH